MLVVNFCGLADKKILVLPLANAMSVLGDTLLVTDDTSYKYYMNEDGKIGNVQVLVKNSEDLKTDAHIEYDDGIDYKNIIYDTIYKIDKKADKIIVVRNKDRRWIPPIVSEVSDEVYDGEVETPTREVVITAAYTKMELKKTHFCDRGEDMMDKALLVELKLTHYRWLQLIAETKNIEPLKDKATLSAIANLVSDVMKDYSSLEALMLSDNMPKGDKK